VAKWIHVPKKVLGDKKCSGCPKQKENSSGEIEFEIMEEEDYAMVNADVLAFTAVLMPSEIPVETEGLGKILTDRGAGTAGVIDAAEVKAGGLALRKAKSVSQTVSKRGSFAEQLDYGQDEWIMTAPGAEPTPITDCELHLTLDLSKCYECKAGYVVGKDGTDCTSKSGDEWVGVRIFSDSTKL
jgi:hypothetical protein